MTIVAAFCWKKAPQLSVSTMIVDLNNLELLSAPKILFLSPGIFAFRKDAREIVKQFISEIIDASKGIDEINIEYKITFPRKLFWFQKPSKESRYIYNYFFKQIKKLIQNPEFKLCPQLRKRLSGKDLLTFKRELRKLGLIERKREKFYEYALWNIALHATSKTYKDKLNILKKKLINKYWETPI